MKHKKIMILALALLLLTTLCCTSALAAGGDVAGAVEQTWKEAATQIKSVVEKVVFPAPVSYTHLTLPTTPSV